jgi:hypothetical protein
MYDELVKANETLGRSYRPDEILTLFVGESAPANGRFFYDGKNLMVRAFQRVTEQIIPGMGLR